jgi:ribosomal protein S18 acetylase RimI-like enzyme
MKIGDYKAVSDLWRKTEGVGLNESDTRPNIAAYLKRNPGMSFVARAGREIIGAVLCGHDGRRGYLHHLAVAKDHRNRGLGRRLVESCLARLHEEGITRCNLFVFAEHHDGESFWIHNGFKQREDLRVMQRPIVASSRRRRKSSRSC